MIDMVQYDDWVDGVNTNISSRHDSASNIPRIVIIHAVRSAIRDFLSKSKVWSHRVDSVVRSGDYAYVVIPRDSYIIKAGYPSDGCKGWLNDHMHVSHPNKITLSGLSDKEAECVDLSNLQVSLSVTQKSLECPLFIFDRYYDGIISGAIALLQMMPGKAWSEPNMAASHAQLFSEVVRQATYDADNGLNKPKANFSITPNFS